MLTQDDSRAANLLRQLGVVPAAVREQLRARPSARQGGVWFDGGVARVLLVPGRGIPRPEHWQQRWADAHPEYRWAPCPPGPPVIVDDRVAALHEAITGDDEPAVLVAHSAGCLVVAAWASRHVGPVQAALLVAPPHAKPRWRLGLGGATAARNVVVPRERLPFRTVLVGSRSDPYTTFEQFEQYAEDWGAELFDAGDAGHIETASGYGPWPEGEQLLAALINAAEVRKT